MKVLDHPLVEVVPNTTGPPGYRCKECNATFQRIPMELHIRTHTGEKPLICELAECGIAFARPSTLKAHQERIHEKICNHNCPICERKFFSRSQKLIHIVIHDEARQTRERILPSTVRKLLTKLEEINFEGQLIKSNCVCNLCGKIFTTPGDQRRHVKGVHSEEQQKIKTENIKTKNNDETYFKYCSSCSIQFT